MAAAAVAAAAAALLHHGRGGDSAPDVLYNGLCILLPGDGGITCSFVLQLPRDTVLHGFSVAAPGLEARRMLNGTPVMLEGPLHGKLLCVGGGCRLVLETRHGLVEISAAARGSIRVAGDAKTVKRLELQLRPGLVAAVEPPEELACGPGAAVVRLERGAGLVDAKLFLGQDILAYEAVILGSRSSIVVPLAPQPAGCYTKIAVSGDDADDAEMVFAKAPTVVNITLVNTAKLSLPLFPAQALSEQEPGT